ncbi:MULTISPECIES: SDR family oxidoreductase [unclassified Psychrobacter]|uniref:SDR family oxidoreductase n=1 Tax=unclassified Psychrobacter TaxID=196806 RepID=UPI0018F4561E|nr:MULTISPECIES: SDR family oxidoreductase [unclassified Psychrobacter]
MTEARWLIIGQGAIGLEVTNQLAADGHPVTGLARRERNTYDLAANADFMQHDARTLTAEQLAPFSHIAIIVTPDAYSESGYQDSYLAIAEHLATLAAQLPKLQRMVFISSTGVYGQDSGEWIDKDTVPTTPTRAASQVIYQAEQVLQSAFAARLSIIRPSGIYGKTRLMRLRQAEKGSAASIDDPHWTNRIMDSDLVQIIVNVLTMETPEPLYIATDYAPVTTQDLMRWLSEQLDTDMPSVNRAGAVTGKRLHSNIPLTWLRYPDWQMGYQAILASYQQQ